MLAAHIVGSQRAALSGELTQPGLGPEVVYLIGNTKKTVAKAMAVIVKQDASPCQLIFPGDVSTAQDDCMTRSTTGLAKKSWTQNQQRQIVNSLREGLLTAHMSYVGVTASRPTDAGCPMRMALQEWTSA